MQQSTERLLALFEKHKTRATFFVLGWVAERLPELIRKIEAQGHEIASHGYNHLLLTEITPQEFEADLAKALEALEKCGVKTRPIGFRAPSFTVVEKTKSWALPILEKYNFKYDSSVFPIGFHPDYGVANAPLVPYKITDGLYEFPMSCVEMFGRRFPFGGGGYFRLFPVRLHEVLHRESEQRRPSDSLLPAPVGSGSRAAARKGFVSFAKDSTLPKLRSNREAFREAVK